MRGTLHFMLCDLCNKNNAVIHIEKHAADSRSQMKLCSTCAGIEGLTPDQLNSENLNKIISDLNIGLDQQENASCQSCGCTLNELQRTNKTGCSQCYDELINHLLLPKWQKPPHFKHIGKTPYSVNSFKQITSDETALNRINKLQDMLTVSISSEDYEEAARLRDEIESLKHSPS